MADVIVTGLRRDILRLLLLKGDSFFERGKDMFGRENLQGFQNLEGLESIECVFPG